MADRPSKRVLCIGWDAADWQMIRPIMDRGHMPTLERFVKQGAWGQIATLEPILSPMLWTSIATGHTADRHGILGFTEPTPDQSGIRPVASTSRTCKALWNLLTQSGLQSNVIGWYASHPAEPIRGVYVSNQFEQVTAKAGQPWPVPAGSVHPAELADRLAEFRVHPSEIDAAAILPFIPDAAKLLSRSDSRIGVFRRLLAQVASIHAVTTWLMENTSWDLTAVYYEGIDRFGHEFMPFHPPKMSQVSEEEYQAYQHVMTGVYRFHDMMLERLLQLAGPETTVILVSDHGYHSDHLRPALDADPTQWHRSFGIVAAAGPGIKKNARLFGATLLDVTPTILRLLGLPVGADMAGRPWMEIFDRPLPSHRVLSWEKVDGDAGLPVADPSQDPAAAQEALKQLIDLGYVDPPGEQAQKNVEEVLGWQKYNLATALQFAGRHEEMMALFRQMPERFRSLSSVRIRTIVSLISLGRISEAEALLATLDPSVAESPQALMFKGTIARLRGDLPSALSLYRQVEALAPQMPGLHERLGALYLAMKHFDDAQRSYESALHLDADCAVAFDGLSQVAIGQEDWGRAVDMALEAVARVYHFPRAHFHLALGLDRLGDLPRAVKAVEQALAQSSEYRQAHELAARLYRLAGREKEAVEQEYLAGQCPAPSLVRSGKEAS